MAGAQTEVTANQIESQRFGYMALSLLEYDTDAEPEIAAGSKVEIGGALFEFASDESITGWGAIGTDEDVYIKLVVAGTAVTAEFTTTAPTWSTSKQGWYGTGGAALDRYVAKLYKDGASAYTLKRLMRIPGREQIATDEVSDLAITAAKLGAKSVQSAKLDDTSTYGTQAIGAGLTWTPPAGLYILHAYQAGSPYAVYLQVYTGAAWIPDNTNYRQSFGGGLVLCDGSTVRLWNAGGDAATAVYRKFE